jgi:hypothetical protein
MPLAPPVFRPSGARAPGSYDAERRSLVATRKLYGTARWRKVRAAQLAEEPLCRTCREAGRVIPADTCDHVEPHRGDVEAFWRGPFQSLCTPCHTRTKQSQERGRRG